MEQLSKLFPPWPSPFIAVFDAFDTITTTLARACGGHHFVYQAPLT